MDWPMLYAGNPVEAEPGMVFFIHIIIVNSDSGRAQTLGRTSVVEARGARQINNPSLDLIVG
jgi:Xaa-Pro dipeptidase